MLLLWNTFPMFFSTAFKRILEETLRLYHSFAFSSFSYYKLVLSSKTQFVFRLLRAGALHKILSETHITSYESLCELKPFRLFYTQIFLLLQIQWDESHLHVVTQLTLFIWYTYCYGTLIS